MREQRSTALTGSDPAPRGTARARSESDRLSRFDLVCGVCVLAAIVVSSIALDTAVAMEARELHRTAAADPVRWVHRAVNRASTLTVTHAPLKRARERESSQMGSAERSTHGRANSDIRPPGVAATDPARPAAESLLPDELVLSAGSGANADTTVILANLTSKRLSIAVSGPVHETVAISPFGSRTLDIPAGSYDITAVSNGADQRVVSGHRSYAAMATYRQTFRD